MAFITKLLDEIPSVEMRPPRAMLMNVAIIGEFWPPLVVGLRQRAIGGKLQ